MCVYVHLYIRRIVQYISTISAESIRKTNKDFDTIQNLVRCKSIRI